MTEREIREIEATRLRRAETALGVHALELLGEGSNGRAWRTDHDDVLKVTSSPDEAAWVVAVLTLRDAGFPLRGIVHLDPRGPVPTSEGTWGYRRGLVARRPLPRATSQRLRAHAYGAGTPADLREDPLLRDLATSLDVLRNHGVWVEDAGPDNVGYAPDGAVVLFDADATGTMRAPQSAHHAPDLPLAEAVEAGHRFVTGTPVTFRYARFPSGATARLGRAYLAQFGGRDEPTGTYLNFDADPSAPRYPGMEYGVTTLQHPLVVPLTRDPAAIYGPLGWKATLATHFKARGAPLSKKLLALGYDAVVTVDLRYDTTSEIVVLQVPTRGSAR